MLPEDRTACACSRTRPTSSTQRCARPARMPFDDLRDQVVYPARRELPQVRDGQAAPRPQARLPHAHRPRGAVVDGRTAHNGEDPLPYYQEPAFSPHKDPELATKYPFILTTAPATTRRSTPSTGRSPCCASSHPNPMHRDQPRRRGSSWAWPTASGSRSERLRPREVQGRRVPHREAGHGAADHGWWFPERQADDDAPDTILPVGEIVEDHEVQAVINGKEIKDGFVKADHADERGLYGVWQSNVQRPRSEPLQLALGLRRALQVQLLQRHAACRRATTWT